MQRERQTDRHTHIQICREKEARRPRGGERWRETHTRTRGMKERKRRAQWERDTGEGDREMEKDTKKGEQTGREMQRHAGQRWRDRERKICTEEDMQRQRRGRDTWRCRSREGRGGRGRCRWVHSCPGLLPPWEAWFLSCLVPPPPPSPRACEGTEPPVGGA